MQIETLKEFVIFTRYSNFTKAAEALNMTQSNLSKHMQQLEQELGFTLNRPQQETIIDSGRQPFSEQNPRYAGFL